MLNREALEAALAELPLYTYHWLEPGELEFSGRIRWICENDCPQYNTSWACPPAVGSVEECREKCLRYRGCLMISSITEVTDISSIGETLATRGEHEDLTDQVAELMRKQGVEPYVLSTESCARCERCAWLDGEKCRMPEKMHPCVESHGINLLGILDDMGLAFQYGENVVTWFSLLFY